MPNYDFRCAGGHEHEASTPRETSAVACFSCGRPAQRFISARTAPRANGFAPKPTREHYVCLDRGINAQHEMVTQAQKAGVQAPDVWQIAKDRVRRGDAVAIE